MVETNAMGNTGRVLFVSHDAGLTGAPMVLLHLLRWIKANSALPFSILIGGGGPLQSEFARLGPTAVLEHLGPWAGQAGGILHASPERLRQVLPLWEDLRLSEVGLIYCNTIANGPALEFLAPVPARVVTHVHELETMIRMNARSFARVRERTSTYLAVSDGVAQNLLNSHSVPPQQIRRINEFIDVAPIAGLDRADCRRMLRAELGLADDAIVVGGLGTTDLRKGPDIFCRVAQLVRQRCGDLPIHFVWVGGDLRSWMAQTMQSDLQKLGLDAHVRFLGPRPNGLQYTAGYDVLALTSREDPYPIVMLESAAVGTPIVCFEQSGGAPDFVQDGCGVSVPFLDASAMADQVLRLLADEPLRQACVNNARRKVAAEHDVAVVAPRTLQIVESELHNTTTAQPELVGRPKVSIILPLSSQARDPETRLFSVLNQTYRDFELLIVPPPDAPGLSPPASIRLPPSLRSRILPLEPGQQPDAPTGWARAVEAARGRFIWIAPPDDCPDLDLLGHLVAAMEANSAAQFAYARTAITNSQGYALRYAEQALADMSIDLAYGPASDIHNSNRPQGTVCSPSCVIPSAGSVLFRRSTLARARESGTGCPVLAAEEPWATTLTHGNAVYVRRTCNRTPQSEDGRRDLPLFEARLQLLTDLSPQCLPPGAVLGRSCHRLFKEALDWSRHTSDPLATRLALLARIEATARGCGAPLPPDLLGAGLQRLLDQATQQVRAGSLSLPQHLDLLQQIAATRAGGAPLPPEVLGRGLQFLVSEVTRHVQERLLSVEAALDLLPQIEAAARRYGLGAPADALTRAFGTLLPEALGQIEQHSQAVEQALSLVPRIEAELRQRGLPLASGLPTRAYEAMLAEATRLAGQAATSPREGRKLIERIADTARRHGIDVPPALLRDAYHVLIGRTMPEEADAAPELRRRLRDLLALIASARRRAVPLTPPDLVEAGYRALTAAVTRQTLRRNLSRREGIDLVWRAAAMQRKAQVHPTRAIGLAAIASIQVLLLPRR